MESAMSISSGKKSILASSFFVILAALAGISLSSTDVMAAGKKAKSAPTENIEPGAKAIEEIDPKAFDRSENIDHPWWPLKPGMQWIFEGYSEDEGKKVPHRIVFTVTDLVKVIGGVRSRVILDADYSEGKLTEKELTFFAQDKVGNVWHLGQYREVWEDREFVGGQIWSVGNPEGAKAGIMMPAEPKVGSVSYSEGFAPPPFYWTDRGRVYQMGKKDKVPAGSYNDVLVIEEFDAAHAGVFQLKSYARGVGNIRIGWRGKNATERENLQLVKVHQLSPKEMAEVRATSLELEKRALMYSALPPIE